MILQALVQHYEDLLSAGKLDAPGWNQVKVSYALDIDASGQLLRVISEQSEVPKGKKMVLSPRSFSLPAPVKRTVGVGAKLLFFKNTKLLGN